MTVHLGPQLEARIQRHIEDGPYNDADDVVGTALRLLEERDQLVSLKSAIAVADEQIARGEVVEWTPDMMDRLKREASENVAMGKPIKRDVRP